MTIISLVKRNKIPMENQGGGLSRGLMLPGMMEGVETFKCQLSAGNRVTPKLFKDRIQIFFFTKGTGYIGTKDRAHNITEIAVFVPMQDQEAFFIQAGTDMEYLNFVVTMNEFDRTEFTKCRMVLPHFCLLKDCVRYVEGFKGPSVKSYTIVEHDNLARISMGVIASECTGPEKVGEHTHQNLQQWYYGLDGCRMSFSAGKDTVLMEDGDCTCIPKLTPHSSTAEAGDSIHYVWFEIKC